MSLHRVLLFAIAALFTAGMTSAASAGCCCGGCSTPAAAFVYAQPVAPVIYYLQPVPAPVQVLEVTPVAPSPIYVVNQGPAYTGPGIMVPYRSWSPAPSYGPTSAYPYVPGYGAAGPRVVYRYVRRPYYSRRPHG
jgi:hypothetical protein